MKRSGPLYTLLAGLALAVFMLVLNVSTGEGTSSYAGAPGDTATATPAPSSPSPSPSPSSPTASASKGPGGAPRPSKAAGARTSYAGRTDDDSAAVSVSVRGGRGGRAIAYFCDGHSKESWLKGAVGADGSMKLSGRGGAVLDGVLAGERIRGTVRIGGRPYGFTAKKAVKPSGLYRATTEVRGAKVDGGWIVLPDGRQVGIVRREGRPSAAPPIDPESGAVTVDGEELTASPVVP